MKELEPQIKDKLNLSGQHAHLKQQKFVGSFKYYKGMKVWEMDMVKVEIKPAEYNQSTVGLDGEIKHTIIQKDNCVYVSALNKKNAERKFKKMLLTFFK